LLIEAKNLAEARQKIAHFTKDGIKSIRNQAKQVIAEIEQKQREIEQAGETAKRRGEEEKQERAGFKEAEQLAQDHIDKNEYDLAKQKIDLFTHSRFGAIRKDAEELLARIVSEEVTYREQLAELEFGRQVESELKKAEKALDSGNLEPVQEFIKKYENNARLTEGQKTRLVEINRRVTVCQRFEENLGLVKQFLVNNEFKKARKILGNWLNSTEKSIATRDKLVYERLPLPAPPGMVPVSGGTYTIGSRAPKDHNPQRAVSVGSFFIDKYEVANTEYIMVRKNWTSN
jgi:formylglycine-generating enzyme required for sulfatase activity